METLMAARRTIVEQLSLFLQVRRRKWTELETFLDECHLTRPAFSLLRALEGETVRGQTLTLQQMQAYLFNPYATRFTPFAHLPLLVAQGYLQQQSHGSVVTATVRVLRNPL